MYYPNYYSYLKTHFNGLINFFGNNATSIFYVSFISLIFFFIRTIYLGIEKKLDFKIYTIVFVVLLVLSE
ncbi:MAG: hypothetical protein EBU01_10135, partial [Crocinitomicaceae bacterium]|nr:hypothetical protein [Crocinitomicaceae bacterium]